MNPKKRKHDGTEQVDSKSMSSPFGVVQKDMLSIVPLRDEDCKMGLEVDTLIEDEEKKQQWVVGIIVGIKKDEIRVHIPRCNMPEALKPTWHARSSRRLAPHGVYSDTLVGTDSDPLTVSSDRPTSGMDESPDKQRHA